MPLASPRVPSSATRRLGARKRESPRDPARRVRQARQHQVDDVLGHVVVAPGDEDLLAGEPIAAGPVRLGARGQGAQVRAGLGLGEVHGPGPFAGDQLGQIERLLPGRAVAGQSLDGRQGEHGAEAEGHVGGLDHLEDGDLQGLGQALAAVTRVGRQPVPAAVRELAIGLREARGRAHLAVLEPGPGQVARPVEGRQDLRRQGPRRFEHGAHRGRVGGRKDRRQPAEIRRRVEGEDQIPNRRLIGQGGPGGDDRPI